MRCASCGYETVVYEGRGLFRQEIIPMECLECHTVQNIVVGGIIGEVAPSFNSEAGRLCPKCSSMNIRRWNLHTCPYAAAKWWIRERPSFGPDNQKE